MKRLVKKASLKTVYHATTLDNLISILSQGVINDNGGEGLGPIPVMGGEKNYEADTYKGYVFVSSTLDYGARLIRENKNPENEIGVIELQVPEEIVGKDLDNPDGSSKSLSIKGSVSSEYFKTIYLLDPTNLKTVLESSYSDWQTKYENYLATGGNNEVVEQIKSYGGEIYYDGDTVYKNVKIEDIKKLFKEEEDMGSAGGVDSTGNIYISEGFMPEIDGITFGYFFDNNTISLGLEEMDEFKDFIDTHNIQLSKVFPPGLKIMDIYGNSFNL